MSMAAIERPFAAGRSGSDDVHQAHRAGGPDRGHAIPGADLAVGWDRRVGLGRRRARGPRPAGEVVVDAADVERDGATDRDTAGHDVDEASKRQAVLERLDRGGIGTEVHDVVECLAGDGREIGDPRRGEAGRLERRPLGGVGHEGAQLGRPSLAEQRGNAIRRAARVRDDEQAAAGQRPPPLAIDVRRLDARPRLDQGDRRCARFLAGRDEEPFVGLGLDDHPLVEQDVLLEPAFEVVAERRVRGDRWEGAGSRSGSGSVRRRDGGGP